MKVRLGGAAVLLASLLAVILPARGTCRATCEQDSGEDLGDGPPSELRDRAENALQRYVELHRAILDPADKSVEKKFLVLQPLLGMGNSQIEEVTALLIAMETDRALVIDLFDRSVGDKVPELEREPWFAPYTDTYDRAIDLAKEQLAAFIQNNAQVNNVDFHPFIFARPQW